MSGPESIDIDSDTFYNEIAKTIKHIVLNLNLNVCLVPHIYKDLKSIDIVLSKLDDILIRKNIIISPCIQGDYGSFFNFSVYKNSKLIIGTRFHANVCGVSMGVDTIGLAVLKRLGHMYNHIRMPESFLMADNFFSKELCSKIDLLVKGNSLRGQYDQLEVLRKESLDLHSELINKFL